MARTDAAADEGLDAAISRARLYVEAGADAIFPEALTDREAFGKFAEAIQVPLLANMTEFGRTPFMTSSGVRKARLQDGDLAGERAAHGGEGA